MAGLRASRETIQILAAIEFLESILVACREALTARGSGSGACGPGPGPAPGPGPVCLLRWAMLGGLYTMLANTSRSS